MGWYPQNWRSADCRSLWPFSSSWYGPRNCFRLASHQIPQDEGTSCEAWSGASRSTWRCCASERCIQKNQSRSETMASAATLRKRLAALLATFGLATEKCQGKRLFSLGSLGPGGATHLLLLTEDSELVRQRGRWVTTKVMELYLQEMLYATYYYLRWETCWPGPPKDPRPSRFIPLQKAISFLENAVPVRVWYQLFQAEDSKELGKKWDGWGTRTHAFVTKNGAAEQNIYATQWKEQPAVHHAWLQAWKRMSLWTLLLSHLSTKRPALAWVQEHQLLSPKIATLERNIYATQWKDQPEVHHAYVCMYVCNVCMYVM